METWKDVWVKCDVRVRANGGCGEWWWDEEVWCTRVCGHMQGYDVGKALQRTVCGENGADGWRVEWGMRATR